MLKKLSNLFKDIATGYLYPLTPPKLLFALAAQQAIVWGSDILLYPRLEDHLLSLGVDKADVESLPWPYMPKFVKPVDREYTIVDDVLRTFETPAIIGVIGSFSSARKDPYTVSIGVCEINVPTLNKFNVVEFISMGSGLTKTSFSALPVSAKDVLTYITLHEAGHCVPGNGLVNLAIDFWNFLITGNGYFGDGLAIDNLKRYYKIEAVADMTYLERIDLKKKALLHQWQILY